jgi:hypothetical protein
MTNTVSGASSVRSWFILKCPLGNSIKYYWVDGQIKPAKAIEPLCACNATIGSKQFVYLDQGNFQATRDRCESGELCGM